MYLFFSSRKMKQQYMYHSRVPKALPVSTTPVYMAYYTYFMEIALSIAYTYNRVIYTEYIYVLIVLK